MKSISFFALFLPLFVFSQGNAEKLQEPKPYIEVVGTATKEVLPDKIVLSVILSEKDNAYNQQTLEKQDQSLKRILSELSVPLAKLSLNDAASAIIRERRRDKTVKLSKEYHLELNSASQVSTFLQKSADAGINEVSITQVDHSKIDSLRKEVRVSAIRAAKDKAIYLTAAVGEQIDKALEIREDQAVYLYQQLAQTNLSYSRERLENDSDSIEADFRLMKIKFSYYIRYALK